MTVEIDRDAMLGALRRVVDVVPGRTTIPILSNLLIRVADGRMSITGTDLEIEATTTVEAAGALVTTVDGAKLVAAVNSLRARRLSIALADHKVTLKGGRGVRTLATLPESQFPNMDFPDGKASFRMPAAAILRLLDTTHVAQSSEETRYYLRGIFLHHRDGKLCAAATDAHKLVRCEAAAPDGCAALPDVIVGTAAVALVRKLLAKAEGEVGITVSDRAIGFEIGETRINAKLVDGTFPDYRRVIPEPSTRIITGARDAFVDPVSAVAAVVNAEGDHKVRMVVFDLGGEDAARVSAQDSAGSSAVEEVDLEFAGAAVRFGVNYQYLTAVLRVFAESDRLTLSVAEPAAPIRITGDKDPDLIAVIMPMRS